MSADPAGTASGAQPSDNEHGGALDQALADLAVVGRLARHDLLAPARIMRSFAELLASEYSASLGEKGLDYVGFILDNAARMRDMAHNLEALARLSNPRFKDGVDLSKIVADVREALEREGAPARLESQRLPSVSGDPVLLRQAVENVIRNRMLSSELECTHFHVSASDGTDVVELTVTDDAAVIEPCERDDLVRPPTDVSVRNLGLVVAQRVALAHGGSLTVASSSAEGTTLRFALCPGGAPTPS